jgi:hypothetical protein
MTEALSFRHDYRQYLAKDHGWSEKQQLTSKRIWSAIHLLKALE